METKEKRKHDGFVVIPRVVRLAYRDLTHGEKWLYVCLKDLCGEDGTCFRSLRTLSDETGIAFGSIGPMVKHLHDAGLIHAEKKRRPGGTRDLWHITIVDIWGKNAAYLQKIKRQKAPSQADASVSTNVQNSHSPNVQNSHDDVQNSHNTPSQCSEIARECVKNLTNKDLTNETSLLNETNERENRDDGNNSNEANNSPSLSELPDDELLQELQRRGLVTPLETHVEAQNGASPDSLGKETANSDIGHFQPPQRGNTPLGQEQPKGKRAKWYSHLDRCYQQASGMASFKYPRCPENNTAIDKLIAMSATFEQAQFVFNDIWDDKDAFWEQHRGKITVVASQFASRVVKMKPTGKRTAATLGSQYMVDALSDIAMGDIERRQMEEFAQQAYGCSHGEMLKKIEAVQQTFGCSCEDAMAKIATEKKASGLDDPEMEPGDRAWATSVLAKREQTAEAYPTIKLSAASRRNLERLKQEMHSASA